MVRMKCWTGPVDVKNDAELLRAAGINVVCEGTEHVHMDVEAKDTTQAREKLILALLKRHGTCLGIRFTPV